MNRGKFILLAAGCLLVLSFVIFRPLGDLSGGTITYEGKTYKTVKIGNQTWMAENLNYDAVGSMCYNNLESNCDRYGRLYNWSTAMNLASNCNSRHCASQIAPKHRGICPDGWHIPSNEEWDQLFRSVYTSSIAGRYLKAKKGWYNCGPSDNSHLCKDTHNFSALPGGYGYSGGNFGNADDSGYWWSSNESFNYSAFFRGMISNGDGVYWHNNTKSYLFSVRCVQD
ncbi:MAG: fibrobacter succinogenes major paralogous domain-containing protein [Fibromonadales bacterium]|nr:fibrobacter succinogenes major paralogous domain-containing protein [Fibromonadales bacterium]